MFPINGKNKNKIPQQGSGAVFLLIRPLQTLLAGSIFILKVCISWTCLDSRFADFQIYRFPDLRTPVFLDFQISRCAAGSAGRSLRSQSDPSPNAPRDQIRRKGPCCDRVPPEMDWRRDHANGMAMKWCWSSVA